MARFSMPLLAGMVVLSFFVPIHSQVTSEGTDSIAACAVRNPWIGAPKGAVSAVTGGCMREFANGNIYFKKSIGAHEVHGLNLDKYKEYKGSEGQLGFPTTDETAAPDAAGKFNHFEGGSIYYYPLVGAYIIYGLIRQQWASLGWERSMLGYPISDELAIKNGGRCTRFQHGNIYYHPTYGTHPVFGEIFEKYSDQAWETGALGYPTSDPGLLNGVLAQYFQGGLLKVDTTRRDLRPEIKRRNIKVRDQGARPTCSVHAMLFLLDYAYTQWCGLPFGGWASDLSEEYLNHAANVASNRTDDGDFFSYIAMGYDTFGIVTEDTWAYDTTKGAYNYAALTGNASFITKWNTMTAQGKTLLTSGLKMKGHFVKPMGTPVGLTNAEFDAVLAYVREGIPVAIGRSHSTVVAGFVWNKNEAGGGHFIIRNSYGDWTNDSGYFTETFASVKSTVNDAYVYEMPYRGVYKAPVLVPVSVANRDPLVANPPAAASRCRIVTIDGRVVAPAARGERVVSAAAFSRMQLSPGVYFLVNGTKVVKRVVR